MTFMDTADGLFMNLAYGWAFFNQVRKVCYNLAITGLSVAISTSNLHRPTSSVHCAARISCGGLERGPFIDRLTFYLGEVNAVHPFREGNGRTQRAFFEQLARDAGFTLSWQHLDALTGDRGGLTFDKGVAWLPSGDPYRPG